MSSYKDIFNEYKTTEGIPFKLFNKRIVFPDDKNLDIYSKTNITSDTPWTILSYQIYGSIEYWWILCALNEHNMYYAREGSTVVYIKSEYLQAILNSIE